MRAPARLALIAVVTAGCGVSPQPHVAAGLSPIFRGHRDVYGAATGAPRPWVLGRSAPIGFCVEASPETDTSQWEARLLERAPVPPSVRLDTTVCFDAPIPEELRDGDHELCAEIRDRFDGSTRTLPCLAFRFDGDDGALRELDQRFRKTPMWDANLMEALASDARSKGFVAFALRLHLISAYELRRTGLESNQLSAASFLAETPAWVEDPAGTRWAAQLEYERAALALDAYADPAACWGLLRSAERSFRLCGDRKWIAVAGKQAEVLSRAGAVSEGTARLRAALAACANAPCDPVLARAAQNTLAWLVASDPNASDDELNAAEESLRKLEPPADDFEHANFLLNLGLLEERSGRDPSATLARARERSGTGPTLRARELRGWADVMAARHALRSGDPKRALALCLPVDDPRQHTERLRAFALGTAARAERVLGRRDTAAEHFARALALHASTGTTKLKKDVPLAPGQRAEDAYEAARLEVERRRPDAAWSILGSLDAEASEATRAPPGWVNDLVALEAPASTSRREQRDAIRWGALDRLLDNFRSRATGPPAPSDDSAVDFRAFPLDDEVVVLRRTGPAAFAAYRRTPVSRRDLSRALAAARDAIDRGEPSDARWAEIVQPLADALVPRPEDLGPTTVFALHGILQEVPLAALPSGSRWLGDVTTVVAHLAGGAPEGARQTASAEAVVVSDPRGDLGLPPTAAGGRVLRGAAATRDALRDALARAPRLHVDAHARYEPAFPELSTIVLADGPVTGHELAAWGPAVTLANLSGCQTGRAPVTADSGRFGIAGLLARSGVSWVIGTRAPLQNDVAIDFNAAFYAALEAGRDVPVAYREASGHVRARHPASRWAVLVLLKGQSPAGRTPSVSGGVR